MKQITRKRALALCICILFILFASSLSVLHDSDHHCAGEDGPVCAHIQMVLHLVRGLSLIGLFLAALILFTQRLHRFLASALIPAAFSSTPVNLKVRLND